MSNVALRANLPYDRLMAYFAELAAAGMLTDERLPALTDKGQAFLRAYRQWTEVLDRFGLPDTAARTAVGQRPARRAAVPPGTEDPTTGESGS